MTNISQELLHVGFCNLVQVLWIIRCFMWKRTRFLLLILPLISSFFFLSNFQISKTFISLFSGTERHTKLKLGQHMDSRLMYHVFLNQAAGFYLFLYFFNFLSLKFQNKFLSHFSVRPSKLKLDTHIYLFLYFFSFLSQNSKPLNFLSHFSVRPSKLKLDTHMSKGLFYCVHQIQTARIFLFL